MIIIYTTSEDLARATVIIVFTCQAIIQGGSFPYWIKPQHSRLTTNIWVECIIFDAYLIGFDSD